MIKVTSTAICGSDLHLYTVLGPFLAKGDVLGHETMGVVEEVGAEVTQSGRATGWSSRSTSPAGTAGCAAAGLFAQCETTQVREQGSGAALFGYTELYGSVPGGQAEYLRVPQAQFGPIKVPDGVPDERVLYLSDILPTAWQGVAYADLPDGGTLAVLGLGPVGQLATRIAAPSGLPGDRGGPRARAAGAGRARTASRPSTSTTVDDVGRRPDRADRRPRPGRGARGGRDGGARLTRGQPGGQGGRAAARRARRAADREGGDRPDGGPAHRLRRRPPRRHGLDQRRVRRAGRPDADDGRCSTGASRCGWASATSSAGSTTSGRC